MKKPKVALVYDAIYPYVKGGGERRFYELGKRMAAAGYDVHLCGMKYWDGANTKQLDGMTLHGLCKARPLYTKDGRRSISQALIFGLSSFKLLFIKFDVMDCCGFPYFSLFPAKLACLLKRKPLYSTWHEVWGKEYWHTYLGSLGFVGYMVEIVASKLPTKIIAASKHTEKLLHEQLHAMSTAVVPNGIDVDYIAKIKKSHEASDIIYVGRLMDFKGVDMLVTALAELENDKLRCMIIGDGPELKSLKSLAKKLGVEKQIVWRGFLKKSDDVYNIMKASKVLVLPSKREGFGLVALEANACGIPVLTADYPGNAAKDLIQVGLNGYIFEPNPAALSAVIEETLDAKQRLSTSARRVASKYDWDMLAKRTLGVYAA